METFQLRHVSFTYPGRPRPALEEVSLTVERGDFLVLCGPSGCGKSTLLRQLKTALTPQGRRTGEVLFQGRPLEAVGRREQAERIGFVLQSPADQVVTDKVWHELAFSLESLGLDTPAIRRRVAEMATFFGIQDWFDRDVSTLSGGQTQLLNLCAVMVTQPSVLILDEPTAQLDPIAAGDFLVTLGRLNRELGTTILLSEHRLEDALPLATRAAVLEGGRLLTVGAPREVGLELRRRGDDMFLAMPTPMRVWAATDPAGENCPVTVREGRDWLDAFAARHPLGPVPPEATDAHDHPPVLEGRELWFRYEQGGEDVVKGATLTLRRGELLALLGGNGTGKTTLLKLLSGLLRPQRGTVEARGRVALLPQSPETLFVKNTVAEDLAWALEDMDLPPEERAEKLSQAASLCRLEGLLGRHPYDLSGGERQRAALAKVLLRAPEILLLDEPTKGMDARFKQTFAQILTGLLDRGVSVLLVSHDVEFCARCAHRCALFFGGAIVNDATPRAFFSGNRFYTTAANRMARDLLPQAVTDGDVIAACGGEVPKEPPEETPVSSFPWPQNARSAAAPKPKALPRWRRLTACLCAALALAVVLHFLGLFDLGGVLAWAGVANRARRQIVLYAILAGSLILLGLALGLPPGREAGRRIEGTKPPLPRVLTALLILALAAGTVWLGQTYLDSRRYYVIALLLLFECMIPFFLAFERRRPQAREVVTVAVLCAIAVAGRALLFLLPEFKPVAAVVIVSGAALGGETGFLVGALTMLASNMMFSQGPWTPWQMFAMGLVGALAGALFHTGLVRRSRAALCLYGALATLALYGGIMNLQSALTWSPELNRAVLLSYCAAGFPMDCVHAAATWVFLWFGGLPLLEKLDRLNAPASPPPHPGA